MPFDLWEDIYKSKWPPNLLPSSEGEEGGKGALKVNFVRLHGSINVTTHVLEGVLKCLQRSWMLCSESPQLPLSQTFQNRIRKLMVLDDGVDQHSCARLHMISCRQRYSTADDHPPGCVRNLKQLPSQSMTSQAVFFCYEAHPMDVGFRQTSKIQ